MGRGGQVVLSPRTNVKPMSSHLLQKPPLMDRPQQDWESPLPHNPSCWTFAREKALTEGTSPPDSDPALLGPGR